MSNERTQTLLETAIEDVKKLSAALADISPLTHMRDYKITNRALNAAKQRQARCEKALAEAKAVKAE